MFGTSPSVTGNISKSGYKKFQVIAPKRAE